MFGDVLRIGVLERERLHDFVLSVFGIECGDELLDGRVVGFARKHDQGVGPVVGRHFNGVLERFAAHLLVKRSDLLDQLLRVDVFQRDDADGDALGFICVQRLDEVLDFRQFRFRRRHDEAVGSLVGPDAHLLGATAARSWRGGGRGLRATDDGGGTAAGRMRTATRRGGRPSLRPGRSRRLRIDNEA